MLEYRKIPEGKFCAGAVDITKDGYFIGRIGNKGKVVLENAALTVDELQDIILEMGNMDDGGNNE